MTRSMVLAFVALLVALVLPSCAQPLQPTLEITPSAGTLVFGETVQLTVTRRFAGGAVEDVTSRVSYATSNRLAAAVLDVPRGLVVAGDAPGAVLIRVTDDATDAVNVVTFNVLAPKIDAIDVSPSPAIVMSRGTNRQFTAIGHFTNGTTKDITGQVLWSSSNQAAAVVSNGASDKGLVAAVATGDTSIVATDAASGIQGRTVVFVTGQAPLLEAIVVSPNPGSVGLGQTLQFSALGILSDGTSRDMTAVVTWSSARLDLATIDANGLATGVGVGDVTITARVPDPTSTVLGSADLKVVP